MKKILFLLFIFPLVLPATVYHLQIDGPIESITEEYIQKSFDQIRQDKQTNLVILQIDTPGGFDTSMRSMIKNILNSPAPVAVFVSPRGARAASAGFFLAMSADIVAMAPESNMGAAHPVSVTGTKIDETMEAKIINDASSYIKSLAESHGRNVEMAEKAVRESLSYTADECLKSELCEYIANDLTDLISQLNGKELKRADGTLIKLKILNSMIKKIDMSFRQKFLRTITNPNLAFILLLIGLAGLYIEFTHPGGIIPGVLGGISLLLAFLAFQILPVNYVGLALILLAIGLFIAEVKVQGFGILGIGGIAAFVLGSLILFQSNVPELRPALSLVIGLAICIGSTLFFLTYKVFQSMKPQAKGGSEGLIGEQGKAKTKIDSNGGKVFLHGEFWNAFSDESIECEEPVVVVSIKNLLLKVKKGGKNGN